MIKYAKILSFLLPGLLLTSCGMENKTDIYVKDSVKDVYVEPKISDSGYVLYDGSFSSYVIVYQEQTDNMILEAVKELNYFFEMATGCTLKTYTDVAYDEGAIISPYISIGKTIYYEQHNFEYDEIKIGNSGYLIKLVNGNVYIRGGYQGNLYGVYEFLNKEFNYECYAPDENYIDKVNGKVYVKNFDILDIPSFDYRIGGFGESSGYAGAEPMNRLRMMSLTNAYVGQWNTEGHPAPFHNSMEYITPGEYFAEHPDWFSPSGTQLCLTRDPEGILEVLVPKMIQELEYFSDKNIITFTQMDGPTWCTCDNCAYKGNGDSSDDGDGGASGAVSSLAEKEYYASQNLTFVNELAKRISKEYTKENGYEHARYVYVLLFNYGMTGAAPIKYDSEGNPVLDKNGNYVCFDETMEIADNLGVLFCYGFRTQYVGEYDKITLDAIDKIKRWSGIVKNFSFWAYSTHFTDYFVPYDSQQQLVDTIIAAYNAGGKAYYNQTQYDMKTPVDWGRLESYLTAKLTWNHRRDEATLVQNFFNNYFKDASKTMKALYGIYKNKMADLNVNYNLGGAINTSTSILVEKYWSYNELMNFLSYIDQAYADIDYLKYQDVTLYQKLYDRINLESMTFRYMLYKLYPNMFNFDILEGLKQQLIDEARTLGVSYAKEHYDISSLFD